MAAVIGGISVYIEDDTQRFSASMRNNAVLVEQQAQRMTRAIGGTAKSVDDLHKKTTSFSPDAFRALAVSALRAQNSVERLRTSMLAVAALAGGGFGGAFAAKALTDMADRYTNIQNKIATVVKDSQARVAAEQQIFDIAQRSRASYEATAQLYQRMQLSASNLGATNQQILQVVETTQKALMTAGATTQEAASAATQLSQALGAGRLAGDELRSILENAPVLAQAIAREFGVGVGQLKEMGAEGTLVSSRVLKAILAAGAEVNEIFGQTAPTVATSLVVLDNALTRYIGQLDKSLGFTERLARGIMTLSENLDSLAAALLPLAALMAGRFALKNVAPTVAAPFKEAFKQEAERLAELTKIERAAAERLMEAQQGVAATRDRIQKRPGEFADEQLVRDRKNLVRNLERENVALKKAQDEYKAILERAGAAAGPTVDRMLKTKEFADLRKNLADAQREMAKLDKAAGVAGGVAADLPGRAKAQERINAALEREAELTTKLHNARLIERRNLPEEISDLSQARVQGTRERIALEGKLAAATSFRVKLENDLFVAEQAAAEKAILAADAAAAAKNRVRLAEEALTKAVRARVAEESGAANRRAMGDIATANIGVAAANRRRGLAEDDLVLADQAIRVSELANAQKALAAANADVADKAEAHRRAQAELNDHMARTGRTATMMRTAVGLVGAGISSLTAFLGGPLGVALTAATVGWGIYEVAQARAAARAEENKKAFDGLTASIERLEKARKAGTPASRTDTGLAQAQGTKALASINEQMAAIQQQMSTGFMENLKNTFGGGDPLLRGLRDSFRESGFSVAKFADELKSAEGSIPKTGAALDKLVTELQRVQATRPDLAPFVAGLLQSAEAAKKGYEELGKLSDEIARNNSMRAAAASRTNVYESNIDPFAERIVQENQIRLNAMAEDPSAAINRSGQQITDAIKEETERMKEAIAESWGDAVNDPTLRLLTGEEITTRIQQESEKARDALTDSLSAFQEKNKEALEAAAAQTGTNLSNLSEKLKDTKATSDETATATSRLAATLDALAAARPDLSPAIAEILRLAGALNVATGAASAASGALRQMSDDEKFAKARIARINEEAPLIAEQEREFNMKRGQQAIELNQRLEEGRLKASGKEGTLEARTMKLRREFPGATDEQLSELARLETPAGRKGGGKSREAREAETFLERLERIQEEAKAGFFTDIDRMTVEELSRIRAKPELLERTRVALETGGELPDEAKTMRAAIQAREAAKSFRALIDEYGTGAQLAPIFADKQEQLNFVVEKGKLTAYQAQLAYADFVTKFSDFSWINDVANAFDSFGNTMADAFLSGEIGAESLGDALKALERDLFKLATNTLILDPLKNLLRVGLTSFMQGGGLGSIFGPSALPTMAAGGMGPDIPASIMHGGGVAGFGNRFRWVPAGAFDNAPRHHRGLGPREIATVLEREETVLTKRQSRGLAGMVGNMQGGGVVNNFEVITPPGSTVERQEQRNSTGGVDVKVLIQQAAAEGVATPGNPLNRAVRANGRGTPLVRR